MPRYLINQEKQLRKNRHCGTMDVDLGISIAVTDIEVYEDIAETLGKMGFEPGKNTRGVEQKHSFVKKTGNAKLILDFLTAKHSGPADSLMKNIQDNLSAIQVEGLALAFDKPLRIQINGKLLSGGLTEEIINICRPIPFVVLKALAFDKRREPKDVYDMVYVLSNCKGGASVLAREATPGERRAEAFKNAISSMKRHFRSPSYDGPVQYGHFVEDLTQAASAFAAVQEFLKYLDDKSR
ncbi:MAG: hypothetical protein WAX69_13670 [Victivallales bacterium]